MARTTTKTKAAPTKTAAQQADDDLMERVTTTAALVQHTLVNAAKSAVPLMVSIGTVGVRANWGSDIMHAKAEGADLVGPTMFAMQAGVLLGAARAAQEMEDGSGITF